MKLVLPRLDLMILFCCSALSAVHVFGASPPRAPADLPGSATMPLKTMEAPLPPPLDSAKEQVEAKLGVWVKPDGSVDSIDVISASREWRETVVATVKKWRFEPVIWEGKPLPARAEVGIVQVSPKDIRVTLSPLPNLPGEYHTEDEFGLTKPLLEVDEDLILPLVVRANGLRIEAAISYMIEEDGTTDKIELLGASSEGAVRSALDLISERKYQPAKIREQPVVFQCKQVLGLQSMEPHIAVLQGAVDLIEPVYPYERLLAQDEGTATVRFTLAANGEVKSTELVEASHSDFGGALVAAVESWMFSPESAVEQNVREFRYDFALSNVSYAARRLIAAQRAGNKTSNLAAGLDARPKAAARPALAYPTSLGAKPVPGSAKIEFVIDRVGLAQVPRVVEATKPEFGWAAATMVNGMRFQPLTRGGKPTEIRVILPITFEPPKVPAAP